MSNADAPTPRDIAAAQAALRDVVRHTPLEPSAVLSEAAGMPVHLKLECWQRTRSFKIRGAYHAIARLTAQQRARGIVTASAGNHGQAVALAARELGAHATVFLPRTAPLLKQERIRRLGAELRMDAPDYDAAEAQAHAYARDAGRTFVHAFSDPDIIAGQGTVGAEILADLPEVRTVVVPVGGGGLVTGIGIVLKDADPGIRVLGVQSTETRAMHAAFEAGRAVDVPVPPTLADGLAGCTDEASYRRARAVVDDIVLVSESEIADAIRVLYAEGVLAEGAGAVGAAAVLAGRVPLAGPVVVVVSGGNIDAQRLVEVLS
ncbi:MAG TPA: pyridoxal-phosphate dependent enzyme [Longimicrobiales bacterium]|nr:pyridoxal-phosphate dependent enzyme [Longimicrobiales bacterium]